MAARRNSESRFSNGRHRIDGAPSGWKRAGAQNADAVARAVGQPAATKKSAITAALAVGVLAVSGGIAGIEARDRSDADPTGDISAGSTGLAVESPAVPALTASATP